MSSMRKRPLSILLVLLLASMLASCNVEPVQPQATEPSPSAVAQGSAPSSAPSAATASTTPAPSASVSPSATSSANAQASPSANAGNAAPAQNPVATLDSLAASQLPRRDLVSLAVEFGRTDEEQRVARTTPLDVQVGDKQVFTVADVATDRNYEITATLVLALDRVLMYVEDGVNVDPAALERSARQFNDEIYPRNRELFGSEWTPGVDGDPRITILNARISGAGGYFSGSDEVPRSVNRYSNEREMFYINIDNRIPGTDSYGDVLAHEFQHMIEWHESGRPTTWMNEGLSQLAEELNGFEESVVGVAPAYLANPDLQLTHWADSPDESLGHYGAAYLFMTYFYEQYGDQLSLQQLIRDGAGERLDVFTNIARQQNPAIGDFGDLYTDWALANLLNTDRFGDGRYTYAQLPDTVQVEALRAPADETVAQFGTDYWELPASEQPRVIQFDGGDTIGAVAAQPQNSVLWWSNRGDSAHSTLERQVDLRNVQAATLQFKLWYDIEQDYDYGFVSVSTDGGETFTTLPGQYTTTDDPQGANWGNGYTGTSGGSTPGWVDEQIDLGAYAGQEIVLRFSLISDDAYHAPGMAIDNISIPEINFRDDAEGDNGWTAQGFVRTTNQLPQQWEVRLVRIDGNSVTFEPLPLGAGNTGEYRLEAGQRGALVVSATTPHTTERASYQLRTTTP